MSAAGPGGQPSRVRRVGTVVLVVLASVAVLAATVAVWARVTLLDSDRFAGAVAVVVRDAEVQAAVGSRLADLAVRAATPTVVAALPEELRPLEPLVIGGLRRLADEAAADLVASERAQAALVDLARAAHAAAMRVLRGDGLLDTVTVEAGEVTVNLVPLVVRTLAALQDRGVLPARISLPEPRPEAPVSEQVAELGGALGRDLPDDFGQLVVYRSEALAEAGTVVAGAQRALALFLRAVTLLVVLAAVLVAGALFLSPNRRRTVLHLGVGIGVAVLLANVVIDRAVAGVAEAVRSPGATLTRGLLRRNWFLVLLSVLAVAGVILLDRLDARGERPGRYVAGHAAAARVVVVLVAAATVVVLDLGWGAVVVAGAVLAGGLAAIAALERRAAATPA